MTVGASAVVTPHSARPWLPGVHLSSLLTELFVSIEAVRALVAERQRYDDGLAALEAKRADTPPRVFDRVHADYVGRRVEVMAQLQAHIGEVAAFGSELEQRLGTLEAQLAAHEEELAEGMLRNLVGEYDDHRWDAVRRDVEGRIVSLSGERKSLLADVDDLRTLIDRARMVPSATERAVAEPPSAEPPSAEPPSAAAVTSIDPVADTSAAVFAPIAAAELAHVEDERLLESEVSGSGEDAVTPGASDEGLLADAAALFEPSSIAAVPESATGTPRVPLPQSAADEVLAMFGEVTGGADPRFVQALRGTDVDDERRDDAETATSASPAPATDDPLDDLAFLRTVNEEGADAASSPDPVPMAGRGATQSAAGGEPRKTLRCTECGAMNAPTEWYCERCGGELAAF